MSQYTMSTLLENAPTEELSDISLKKRDYLHESEMNLSSAPGYPDERSITVEHLRSEMKKKHLADLTDAFFGDAKTAYHPPGSKIFRKNTRK